MLVNELGTQIPHLRFEWTGDGCQQPCSDRFRRQLTLFNVIDDGVQEFPRNPRERTGIRGRGVLGKWGPNYAADPIVTRYDPETGKLLTSRPTAFGKYLNTKVGLRVGRLCLPVRACAAVARGSCRASAHACAGAR